MRIYLSPITDLTALYTNLSEIWLRDPAKRRLMRARGIDEATVRGDRGDLALLRAYLSVLPEKGGERRRAEAELAVLSLSLTDADALWTAAAERLRVWSVKDAVLARSEELLPAIPFGEDAPSRPFVLDLSPLLSPAPTEEGITVYLARMAATLSAYADRPMRAALLTLPASALPACLRAREDALSAALALAPSRRRAEDRDALANRMLFTLLPLLRERGLPLILRAGAIEWGDGRLPSRFDAPSLCALAERLEDRMPRTLLAPRSLLAEGDMRALCGIFPAIDGFPRFSLPPRSALSFHRSPLSLLAEGKEGENCAKNF